MRVACLPLCLLFVLCGTACYGAEPAFTIAIDQIGEKGDQDVVVRGEFDIPGDVKEIKLVSAKLAKIRNNGERVSLGAHDSVKITGKDKYVVRFTEAIARPTSGTDSYNLSLTFAFFEKDHKFFREVTRIDKFTVNKDGSITRTYNNRAIPNPTIQLEGNVVTVTADGNPDYHYQTSAMLICTDCMGFAAIRIPVGTGRTQVFDMVAEPGHTCSLCITVINMDTGEQSTNCREVSF